MTISATARPLRLAALAGPTGPDRLCLIDDDGRPRPVGSARDVADLLAREPSARTLAEAVDRAGVGEPLPVVFELSASTPQGRPEEGAAIGEPVDVALAAPVRPAEVWAAGVTYERSRDARMRESEVTADVYQRVYDADRPELFLKATAARIVGPGATIGLRSDSSWQVPEPELGLVLAGDGTIVGYTLGDDVSSRDIEGENPLYLPQAKIFAGSCALGPVVVAADALDPYDLELRARVVRDGRAVWSAQTSTNRFHTRLERLVDYLRRDNWLPAGAVLLTGTGIVPDDGFTLQPGDVVEISCDLLGTLANPCAPAATLIPPEGWERG
jgi:2-dehydro-3-deoxy-D-arabinonate dehydratase